jgi:hypothetical protein
VCLMSRQSGDQVRSAKYSPLSDVQLTWSFRDASEGSRRVKRVFAVSTVDPHHAGWMRCEIRQSLCLKRNVELRRHGHSLQFATGFADPNSKIRFNIGILVFVTELFSHIRRLTTRRRWRKSRLLRDSRRIECPTGERRTRAPRGRRP